MATPLIPINITNVFASQAGPIPLSELDANFTQLVNALNACAFPSVSGTQFTILGNGTTAGLLILASGVARGSGGTSISFTDNTGQKGVVGYGVGDDCYVSNTVGLNLWLLQAGTGIQISFNSILGYGPIAGTYVDMTPDTGTFTGTLTGMTGATSGTFTWRKIGRTIWLFCTASVFGTSASTAMTMTGLPSVIAPSNNTPLVRCVVYDNAIFCDAIAQIGSNSTITFSRAVVSGTAVTYTAGAGFTASGTKGIPGGTTIMYTTD